MEVIVKITVKRAGIPPAENLFPMQGTELQAEYSAGSTQERIRQVW
jgi:hypothetical protein